MLWKRYESTEVDRKNVAKSALGDSLWHWVSPSSWNTKRLLQRLQFQFITGGII